VTLDGRWTVPAAGVVALLLAALVFPDRIPLGVVVVGAMLGTGTGLLAVGLVLTYRTARVVNFAYGAMGGVGGGLAVGLYGGKHWPWAVVVPLAVVSGAVVGAVTERLVIRRFFTAPRLILTVATIGLAQVLGGIAIFIPDATGSSPLVGAFETPLSSIRLSIDPVIVTGNDLLLVAVVPLVLVALSWFLLRTDAGIALRAIATNVDRARLLGIPVQRLSLLLWTVVGAFAALTIVLKAPSEGLTLDVAAGPAVLLPALAAGVVAGMSSLPRAFAAGVALGVLDQLVRWNVDRQSATTLVLLAVIVAALLVRRRPRTKAEAADESSWSSASTPRPLPATLAGLREVRIARWALVGLIAIVAVGFPVLASPSQTNRATVGLAFGLVAVSLVVLTGWGGVVSLGQVAILGAGGVVTANLLARWNVDLFWAVGAAAVAGMIVALLLGLPALRVPGQFLAVTTLAFAVAVDLFIINPTNFAWLIPTAFDRPVLWKRFALSGERPLYYVALGLLVAALALARGLRRARAGRVVIATRDNEQMASAGGVDTVRAKLMAFVASGILVAVAGAIHAVSLRGIGLRTYPASDSLLAFSMAVIGGISSLGGSLGGVLLVQGAGYAVPKLQLLLTGTGLLLVLLVLPGGLAQAFERLRDRFASAVARRRGIELVEAFETAEERAPIAVGGDDDGALLRCNGVRASYGSLDVLFGVDMSVREGELIALLGTNGAGKSTFLKAFCGLLPPTGGRVAFAGEDITGLGAEDIAARGISLMPGGRGVFPTLTVAENLRLACWLLRKDRAGAMAARERVVALFPILRDRSATQAGNLSGGEQQMLSLALAFTTRPRVLCIDELSLGLAPMVVSQLVDTVRNIHKQGTTVVLVEQSVNVALLLAERAVFLEKGQVRYRGKTSKLLDRPDILRAVFLGQRTRDVRRRARTNGNTRDVRLETQSITKHFGGVIAVNDVDLVIEPGSIVGLIGHNGAGKTTLFDVLSGFIAPDRGRVVLGGDDVTGAPPHKRAIAGLGRSFQEARLYPTLTVRESIAVSLERHLASRDPIAAALRLPASTDTEAAATARVDELIELVGLAPFQDKLTSDLSTGTRRIAELACLLALDPAVVLFDEPSAGIAQREAEALGPLLRRIQRETGCSILVIEHDMSLLSSLCDELVALELGTVITRGRPSEVLAHPVVIESYLGTDQSVVRRSGSRARAQARRR
jgi:ABC-type branched-subunit amino acid transport system ATPase component/ABC-type branched-subunit amino acid transport system permease subunit